MQCNQIRVRTHTHTHTHTHSGQAGPGARRSRRPGCQSPRASCASHAVVAGASAVFMVILAVYENVCCVSTVYERA